MQKLVYRAVIMKALFILPVAAVAGCGFGQSQVVDLRATISGPATLKIGTSYRYIATVESTPSRNLTSPHPITGVTWESSNLVVATVVGRDEFQPGGTLVATGGVVTARTVGQVVVTATPELYAKFVRGTMTPGSITITIVE